MKEHWNFFKENDTSFGLFYPLHYTVAAFDTLDRAEQARRQCLDNGFDEDDVAAVSGPFVINHLESGKDDSWFTRLQAGIARVIGTETGFLDDDLQLARRGCAFLFVYTPGRPQVDRLHDLIRRLHPIFARRYHHAGIERIRYPPQSTL